MSVQHALLYFMANEPALSVAQLQRQFETATANIWPINVGQVYQTIKRLHRDELITSGGKTTDPDSGRTVELFSITDEGRQQVEQWFTHPTITPWNARDELVIKIALAAEYAHGTLPELLQRQRQAVMKELRDVTRRKADTSPTQRADRLLIERRIFDLEAMARWLDHVETLQPPDDRAPTSDKNSDLNVRSSTTTNTSPQGTTINTSQQGTTINTSPQGDAS